MADDICKCLPYIVIASSSAAASNYFTRIYMFSNALTIVLMAAWTTIALWGYYRGAMRTVISISILIISIAASVFISPKVNEVLVSSQTVNTYSQQQSEAFVEARIKSLEEGDGDLSWAEYLPLPSGIKEAVAEGDPAVIGALLGTSTVKSYLSELVSKFLIRALSIIVTFILSYIIMCVVRLVFSLLSEAPVISQLNRIAGLFLGVFKGAVLIWIFFAFLRMSSMTSGPGSSMLAQVQESEILGIMYTYNPLFTILPGVLGLV